MNANPLTRLRLFIANSYSMEDFRLLCTDLAVLYDDLGGDDRITVKADRLLYLVGQQRRYGELLLALRQTRPKAFEQGGFHDLISEALQDALPVYAGEQVTEPGQSKGKRGSKKADSGGRYEVQEELGRGSFAVVYKALDTVLNRPVAMKVLHPYWQDKPEFVGRFNLEARTAANLHHPNIIKVYDSGQDNNGQLFMVMEYLPGQSLQEYLKTHGILALEDALSILEQVAASLDYAHEQGIVHRDVKPGNIIVIESAAGLKAYLTDFGLVKAMEGTLAETITVQATNLGSPEYMSPEQADPHHQQEVGPAADRYALGVLAYRLLTGKVPFSGSNWMATLYGHVHLSPPQPRQIRPDLSEGVERVLLKMLAKSPYERFVTCADFVATLVKTPEKPDTWINPITGKEMVRILAGLFLFGEKKEKRELPEYWIDKTPVTNAEYARFVAEKGYEPPKHWLGKKPPPELAEHPVVYVNWSDANAYAEWAGGRLPSGEQWEKAARGTDGRQYPWGDEWQDGRCNTKEANIGKTTPVGRFSPAGDSPFNCVGMSGNVWEWLNEKYVIKGGSWRSSKDAARAAARFNNHGNSGLDLIGFRVVAAPSSTSEL